MIDPATAERVEATFRAAEACARIAAHFPHSTHVKEFEFFAMPECEHGHPSKIEPAIFVQSKDKTEHCVVSADLVEEAVFLSEWCRAMIRKDVADAEKAFENNDAALAEAFVRKWEALRRRYSTP